MLAHTNMHARITHARTYKHTHPANPKQAQSPHLQRHLRDVGVCVLAKSVALGDACVSVTDEVVGLEGTKRLQQLPHLSECM